MQILLVTIIQLKQRDLKYILEEENFNRFYFNNLSYQELNEKKTGYDSKMEVKIYLLL